MFRKCVAPLTAGAVLFATSVSGAPQSLTFPDKADSVVVPAGSPLHFHAFKAGDNDTAEFAGKILLSGTYYILGGNELSMIFVPDDATVARLPHLKKHSGEDTVTIGISGFASFASTALSPAALAALKKKSDEDSESGKASIWVDGFAVSLVCGGESFGARFVSTAMPPKPLPPSDAPVGDC